MAKRINNYSRTNERVDYKESINIDENLNYLENNGRLKYNMYLAPSSINIRCNNYYNTLIHLNYIIKNLKKIKNVNDYINDNIVYNKEYLLNLYNIDDNYYIKNITAYKIKLQNKFLNLATIIIGNCIKKFPTLYPLYYNDLQTACIIDILDKINKNNYNAEKSSLHSYIFETCYWAIIKYLAQKAQYENNTVQLLQV